MKPPTGQTLKLAQIEIADLQARAATDDKTIEEYSENVTAGEKFPPVVVFHDGKKYYLADGFHRYFGFKKAGLLDILADVRSGSRKDALWFAAGANKTHGLKRSPADKRHAVELALRERPELSDRSVAQHVGVSNTFVGEVRGSTVNVDSCAPQTRIGLDGRERRLPVPQQPKSSPPPFPRTETLPPHVPPLDKTGHPIPSAIFALWERAEEVQGLLSSISTLRGIVEKAEKEKDAVFSEVNFGSLRANLDQAFADLKTAKPFAVCPTCQGRTPDRCTLCKGRGFISEFRWNTAVPKETKEIRAKAKK